MKVSKVFHADHGVSESLIQWAVDTIAPTTFFLRTLEIPAECASLRNALYGPVCGDEPVAESDVRYASRGGEGRGLSRMVERPTRPTRLLTVIGIAGDDGAVVFTAYGGPAAEREPTDPSIADDEDAKRAAQAFWADHALGMTHCPRCGARLLNCSPSGMGRAACDDCGTYWE